MPNSLPQYKPIVGTGSSSVEIININIPFAATEVSVQMVDNLQGVMVRSRNGAELQLTFVSGESGTKYITLKPRSVLSLNSLAFSTSTLYLQSNKPNTEVEILQTFS